MDASFCADPQPINTNSLKQELFSVNEFCRKAGFSRGTFWRLKKDGKLPPLYKIRGKNYVRAADLSSWLEQFRV